MITIEDEHDLWKLFSDAPDQPGNRVRTFGNELNIVLKSKIKLTDTTRFYHLFPCGLSVPNYALWSGTGSSAQAIVTQANLRTVGLAMVRRFTDVAVQYLGPLPGHEKSSKHRKAEELAAAGYSIRIIRETDFRQLVATV